MALFVAFSLGFSACESPVAPPDSSDQNPPASNTGVLAIANLPTKGEYTVGVYNYSGTITNLTEWAQAAKNVIATGQGNASSSVTLYKAPITNPSVVFSNTGTYMVALIANASSPTDMVVLYKTGVSFSNGNATVDVNAMTEILDNGPNKLTITNLPASGNYAVGVYNYADEIADAIDWAEAAASVIAVGQENASSSVTLYKVPMTNPPEVFNNTGTYMVALVANPTSPTDMVVLYKTGVTFTNGSASVDVETMTDLLGNGPTSTDKGKLTVANFPAEASFTVGVYDFAEKVNSQMDIATVQADLDKILAGSVGTASSSPISLMKSAMGGSTGVFDGTGMYLVLFVRMSSMEVYYAHQVEFTNGSADIDFEGMGLTSDLPLTDAQNHTVTFVSNGGDDVPPQEISSGGTVTEPTEPVNGTLYFGGWYEDDITFTDKWDFENDTVNGDITLYAKWSDTFFADSMDAVREFLNSNTGTQSEPLRMEIAIDLGSLPEVGSGWRLLLDALAVSNDFVALELSACTLTGTAFDHDNYPGVPGINNIVELILPEAITSIGNYAFNNCTSLKSVSCPAVTSIGDYSFYSCYSLTNMSFPVLTTIGDFSFERCNALTDVSLLKVTTIGNRAFYNCTDLKSVSFPTVTTIGDLSFYSCYSLTDMSFPVLTTIGDSSFLGCSNLTDVSFPAVSTIGEGAFLGCNSLITVSIPNVTKINANCFRGSTIQTIIMGAVAPTYVGINCFLNKVESTIVTVRIPAGARGYDVPGTVFPKTYNAPNGVNYTVNWANGFRAKGWNGTAFVDANVYTVITLVIEEME